MAILATVSTADLKQACELVDSILGDALVVKAAPEDARLEEFRMRYMAALGKVLRGQFDRFDLPAAPGAAQAGSEGLRGEIDGIMAWAERAFGPELAEKLLPETRKYLRSAFRLGQAARVVPDNVKVLWDRPRQEALGWLVEHDRFWIGKVFPEHLSDGFRETVIDGMERGLGRADIARMLQSQVIGTPEAPGGLEYYRRVASTTVNRARNWGGVFSLHTAGFTEYEIRAVRDERTSPICLEMDGKVFRVRDAMASVERALAGPPSAIESIAPFPRHDAERDDHYVEAGGERAYLNGRSSAWLAGHGLSLPPYHCNCFPRGTRVLTARGWVPIERVRIGDEVYTHRLRLRAVYATPRAVSGSLVRIRTRAGRVVLATPEHPVRTERGWVPARDLRPGDTLTVVSSGVRCAACGFVAPSSLQWHIRRVHGLSAAEYRKRYSADIICPELKAAKAESARRQIVTWAATASPEERKSRVRKANEAARANPNHSSWLRGRSPWNKGLTKEDDPRVAESSLRMLQANPMARPDVRAKVTGENHWDCSGTNNPMYGRPSPFSRGRTYTYRGVRMRSLWEVRAAEFMDGIGIGWEYEPERFVLGDRTYTPDFRLETGHYVEIKGWFHERHRETIRRFREAYPKLELIVITKPEELQCLTQLRA